MSHEHANEQEHGASHPVEHHCEHHGDNPPMCSCDHNPGGECHCPPNECKCDQQHHLIGQTQEGHNCCTTGGEHDLPSAAHDHGSRDHSGHDMHAGHDHSGHAGHEGHDHSHHDPGMFKKQFWMALGLTLPTIVFSHTVQMLFGLMWDFPFSYLIPAVFGAPLFFTGGKSTGPFSRADCGTSE